MSDGKTIEKGYLGQILVEKEFLKHGWNIYKPVLENGKVDLIIEKNNTYLRLQVKTVQSSDTSKVIPVRKISHNMGEYKIKRYTKDDIDYFIGADIDEEVIYILPVSFSSNYASSIAVSKCTQYKNNFKQMEPLIGNSKSADDDNVESLTGNADGNDVGIEISSRERVDNRQPKARG